MTETNERGCRNLEIYQLAHELALRVHAMSRKLPFFEDREEGSQIRRSSKSVSCQIVEGYRLRKYRDEFLHYLHRAAGSADESREHLDYLMQTGSLKDLALGRDLAAGYDKLNAGIARFIMGVERDHSKPFYLWAGERPRAAPSSPQSEIGNLKSPGDTGIQG